MSGPRADEILLSSEANETLASLEASNVPALRAVARRVRAYQKVLLADCLHGEVVKKSRIPNAIRGRYNAENLYVEDLPGYWRLLYTVVVHRERRYVLILAIINHRTYSRWFRRGHG